MADKLVPAAHRKSSQGTDNKNSSAYDNQGAKNKERKKRQHHLIQAKKKNNAANGPSTRFNIRKTRRQALNFLCHPLAGRKKGVHAAQTTLSLDLDLPDGCRYGA